MLDVLYEEACKAVGCKCVNDRLNDDPKCFQFARSGGGLYDDGTRWQQSMNDIGGAAGRGGTLWT